MLEPKISIIVPVNNVEGYLSSCLDSLINQTFKEIEIICVNDGSTDFSQDVLEEYSKKDSRVIVINEKQKKGQAFARNQGLKIARGEYIGFMDGDDWAELDMFEKLYESAKTYDTDITMCATHVHNEYTESSSHDSPYYNLKVFNESFDNRSFSPEETKDFILDINVAIWNKIYKIDFLQKINAKFKEGYIYEDLPFFFETYLRAEKISLVREFLYFYRTNRFGSTMSQLGIKVLDRIDMVSLTYELLKKMPYYQEIKTKIIGWIINDLFHRYTLVYRKYKKEFYFKMQKLFRSIDLVEIKGLKDFYCYEEFLLVKNSSYEECNNILFLKYKDSKKTVKEINYFRIIQLNEKVEEYEKKLKELKNVDKKFLEMELKNQKDWFEKKLRIELETYKNSFEIHKQTELSLQKNYYENEMRKKLEAQKYWFQEDKEKRVQEIICAYENELGKKLKENNEWHENKLKENNEWHENKLKENNEWYQNEMQQKLDSQQQWLEGEFERRKLEIDNWYNNNLEERLLEQKQDCKDYVQKLRQEYSDYIYNQKCSYEKEISNVKVALKVVKKAKKIARKIINVLIKPKTKPVIQRPKVSVILPVYNVDKYLRQSLDSLLNQSLKNIEIICVNDGSTDDSANILEEYKTKDNRIKVIHKQNAGTGAARNDGLKIATGECIGFVDPDDWVKENMFERLYNLFNEKNLDIVMCSPGGFDEENQVEADFPYFVDANFKKELDNKIFSWRDISPFSYPMCVWNKLYKKELFDKNNIEFAEGLDFEDHKVIFKSLLTAERIFFIREKLYIYRFNRVGSILSDNNARLMDHIKIFDIVENILNETNTMKELRSDFLMYKIHNILYYYGMIKEEYKQTYYSKMKDSIKETNLSNEEIMMLSKKYPELEKIIQ